MYNKNICCHYIKRCTMQQIILLYIVSYKTMYTFMYKTIYTFTYNKIICCHCTSFYIMTTNNFVVYRLIRDDIQLLT